MHVPEDVRIGHFVMLLERIYREKRPCKLCGATLYFIPTRDGTIAVYTAQGIPHEVDCPGLKKK